MKQKFLFAILAVCLSIAAQSQRFFDVQSLTSDTLINQTTKTYGTTFSGGPAMLEYPYYYSVHVKADSLSGSNAGTCYLQVSNDRSGAVWYTLQSMTIDGTGSDAALWEGIVYARRIRVYFDMPSGTRRVKPNVYASYKRLN